MGQYYKIINVDKKEFIKCFKLCESSYIGDEKINALMNRMTSDWKGDRIYVIGDYAYNVLTDNETDNPCYKALKHLSEEFGTENIYDAADHFAEEDCDDEDHGYRYVYNHATRQVIDLAKCPIDSVRYDSETGLSRVYKFSPLSLLLTIGNGYGGGDFGGHSESLVGSWCDTVKSIEITDIPLEDCSSYSEFAPDFTIAAEPFSYTRESECINNAKYSKYGRWHAWDD